jgi:hypothetical protein
MPARMKKFGRQNRREGLWPDRSAKLYMLKVRATGARS